MFDPLAEHSQETGEKLKHFIYKNKTKGDEYDLPEGRSLRGERSLEAEESIISNREV